MRAGRCAPRRKPVFQPTAAPHAALCERPRPIAQQLALVAQPAEASAVDAELLREMRWEIVRDDAEVGARAESRGSSRSREIVLSSAGVGKGEGPVWGDSGRSRASASASRSRATVAHGRGAGCAYRCSSGSRSSRPLGVGGAASAASSSEQDAAAPVAAGGAAAEARRRVSEGSGLLSLLVKPSLVHSPSGGSGSSRPPMENHQPPMAAPRWGDADQKHRSLWLASHSEGAGAVVRAGAAVAAHCPSR